MNKQKTRVLLRLFISFHFISKQKIILKYSLSLCSLSLSLQQITSNHKIKHDAYKYDLSPSDNVISSLKDVIIMM